MDWARDGKRDSLPYLTLQVSLVNTASSEYNLVTGLTFVRADNDKNCSPSNYAFGITWMFFN